MASQPLHTEQAGAGSPRAKHGLDCKLSFWNLQEGDVLGSLLKLNGEGTRTVYLGMGMC